MLLGKILTEALQDEGGAYSLTRVAELLGYVTATVVVFSPLLGLLRSAK